MPLTDGEPGPRDDTFPSPIPGCWRCGLAYNLFDDNDVYCPRCGVQN